MLRLEYLCLDPKPLRNLYGKFDNRILELGRQYLDRFFLARDEAELGLLVEEARRLLADDAQRELDLVPARLVVDRSSEQKRLGDDLPHTHVEIGKK